MKNLSAAVGKFYYPVCSVGANFDAEFTNGITFKAAFALCAFFAVAAEFSSLFEEGSVVAFVIRNIFIVMAVCNFFAKRL